MEDEEDKNIYFIDDRGLADGSYYERILKEALEHCKESNNKDNERLE